MAANPFDQFDPSDKANPFDQFDEHKPDSLARRAVDVGISGLRGLPQVGQTAYQLADVATGGGLDKASTAVTDAAGNIATRIGDTLTGNKVGTSSLPEFFGDKNAAPGPQADMGGERLSKGFQALDESIASHYSRDQQKANKEVDDAEGFIPTIVAAVKNPSTIVNSAVQSLPVSLGMMSGVRMLAMRAGSAAAEAAAAKGLTQAEIGAARNAAIDQFSTGKAGIAAQMGTDFLTSGAQQADQAKQAIEQIPEEELQKSPMYQQLLKTLTPEQAREKLASNGQFKAFITAGTLSALTSPITAKLEGSAATAGLKDRAAQKAARDFLGIKGLGKSAGAEFLQEGLQSAGEQVGTNVGMTEVDPNYDLTKDVGNQAATGALAGALMGAGFHAVAHAGEVHTPVQDAHGNTIDPNAGPLSAAAAIGVRQGTQPDLALPGPDTPHPGGGFVIGSDGVARQRTYADVTNSMLRPGSEKDNLSTTTAMTENHIQQAVDGGLSFPKAIAQRVAIEYEQQSNTPMTVLQTPKGDFTVLPTAWVSPALRKKSTFLQGRPPKLGSPDAQREGFAVNSSGTAAPRTERDEQAARSPALAAQEKAVDDRAQAAADLESGNTPDVRRAAVVRAGETPPTKENARETNQAEPAGPAGDGSSAASEPAAGIQPDGQRSGQAAADRAATVEGDAAQSAAAPEGQAVRGREEKVAAIDAAAHEAATSSKNDRPDPTRRQLDAGNYKKGHFYLHGLDIAIETAHGETRTGEDEKKRPWSVTMSGHYGHIRGVPGMDGQPMDATVGPNPDSRRVFVIDQNKPNGNFDEHKVFIGYDNADDARQAYLDSHQKGWRRIRGVTETSIDGFKNWTVNGAIKAPFTLQTGVTGAKQIETIAHKPYRFTRKPIGPVAAPSPVQPEVRTNERRKDAAARKRVADMTEAEKDAALLTSDLTGLRNKRAYEDSDKRAIQTSLDVDSLKWVNDNLGHQAGDEMLKAVGEAISRETGDGYHVSGDEFIVQADTAEEAAAIVARVNATLDSAVLEYTAPDGTVITKSGIGVSYGTGATLGEAETSLQKDKLARERSGARAGRGEEPRGVARRPAEGRQAEGQAAPGEGTEAAAAEEEKVQLAETASPEATRTAFASLANRLGAVPRVMRDLTEDQRIASAVAKQFGMTFTVFDSTRENAPNAFVLGNDAFINSSADDGPMQLVMHEALHNLPNKAALVAKLRPLMKNVEDFSKRVGYSDDVAHEELAAFFAQSQARTPAFWQAVRERVGDTEFGRLAKLILSKLSSFFKGADKLYGAGFVSRYFSDIEAARAVLADAYAEALAKPMESKRIADFTDPNERLEVSTTSPASKKSASNSVDEKWVIDKADITSSTSHVKKLVDALMGYNTLRGKGDQNAVMQELHDNVVSNLLWLHDAVPAGTAARAKLWYDGARRIATDWAAKYGLGERQASGVLAVLSPQKDWFMNVSLGERVIDIMRARESEPWSPAMTAWVQSWVNASKTPVDKAIRSKVLDEAKSLEGRQLGDMDDAEAAKFIRVFDETYNERNYRIVTPEGGYNSYVTNSDSGNASITWGSFGSIEKAVSIMRDGSFRNIDDKLGREHKVRNFYNNIIAPNSADGHVTIDTHAVGAALIKAVSGQAPEVMHNFGRTGGGANVETGASGTYALFADAYRDAAAQRGILPREMQSITWEAVRAMFPANIKDSVAPKTDEIWNRFKAGEISREQARHDVAVLSGGIRPTAWEGGDAGIFPAAGGTSYDTNIPSNETERKARTLAPQAAKDKINVALAAATSTIPGLDNLHALAQRGNIAASALLQDVALDSVRHLLDGTSAVVKADRAIGLFNATVEPSLALSITFTDSDRPAVLAALAKFADNFNQEEVHVRQQTKAKAGTAFPDGSYATLVYRWDLDRALDRKTVQKTIDQSGLYGLTFGDDFVEAYYVGDPKDDQAISDFVEGVQRANDTIGKSGGRIEEQTDRLWPYGRRPGTIGFGDIAGDVSAGALAGSATTKRVAEFLAGTKVKAFDQQEITPQQADLQSSIARAYEALPDNDLANPRVERAYRELDKALLEQFKALPIKAEVYTGTGEPYANSAAMRRDVQTNNHLFVFGTNPDTFGPEGSDFTGHPLLVNSGEKDANGRPLLFNDLLRVVHDYYAHNLSPVEFGPKGEEAAWKNHMAATMNPWARWALTSETRGQNSWVNFRPEIADTPVRDRPFARQKVALLPVDFALTGDRATDAPMKAFIAKLPAKAQQGSQAPKFSNRIPGFYSGLERAIDSSGPWPKTKPGQTSNDRAIAAPMLRGWLAARAKEGIVKTAEIDATGVDDWLKLKGNDKVSQRELHDFFDDHGIVLNEHVLRPETDELPAGWRVESYYGDDDEVDGYVVLNEDGDEVAGGPTRDAAIENAQDEDGGRDASELTRFEDYTLPGGKNYRELLMTLPTWQLAVDQHRSFLASMRTKYPGTIAERQAAMSSEEREKLDALASRTQITDKDTFSTAHFPGVSNIVAHVRFNERTSTGENEHFVHNRISGNTGVGYATREGAEEALSRMPIKGNLEIIEKPAPKKTLFIEEIQSDWAQQGKKQGFAKQEERKNLVAPDERAALMRSMTEKSLAKMVKAGLSQAEIDSVTKGIGHAALADMSGMRAEYNDLLERERLDAVATQRAKAATPPGPFVQKTEAWVALAMKRMIRYAAEHGFDRIAMVTGQQSADRYDLSKHIDMLALDGPMNGGGYELTASKNDSEVASWNVKDEAETADAVGKEVARKLFEKHDSMHTELHGVDLKVGGEGMRAFYDKIVPNVTNDVLKKLGGGRVGEVSMEFGEQPPKTAAFTREYPTLQQPGFDITPELKATVLGKGVPMFSNRVGDDVIERPVLNRIADNVKDAFRSSKTFNWWHRTIGTQYHKAQTNPFFKAVFDLGQRFLQDTSQIAMNAADLAPNILPKLGSIRDVFRPGLNSADEKAVSKALFLGTLDANPRVWSAAELTKLGLNEKQQALYSEARAAIDRMLDETAASEIARSVRGSVSQAVLDAIKASPTQAEAIALGALNGENPAVAETVSSKAAAFAKLKKEGYAPLMRFGQYTVYVQRANGETAFFMRESEREANKLARALRESEDADAVITQGIMAKQGWQSFQGMNPDTIELFAEALGVDGDEAFQTYLQKAVNNQSVLKRLIHRKGIEGYSDDVPRVLASFVTSSAKMASKNYNMADLSKAVQAIPKEQGDIKDEASKLEQYLKNPTQESPMIRGWLFTHFIGGSIASAITNMTQPVLQTLPYLSQWGTARAASELAKASALAAVNTRVTGDAALDADLVRAEKDGVLAPHELHQLYAESIRSGGLTNNNYLRRAQKVWGSFFSLAESFNRRATFIAAWRVGQSLTHEQLAAAGVPDVFAFAEKAIHETQGIYNRGNRPNWARGAIGATLFTFKQFSVSYLEFLKRLPPKEQALALAILVLAAGAKGLPFSEDIEDIIDTIGQSLGYDTNSKESMRRTAISVLGENAGGFVMNGVSAIPGMPLDIAGRLGLSNLIPGTSILKRSADDKLKEAFEVIGPLGAFVNSLTGAVSQAQQGNWGGIAQGALPLALQNGMKGIDMLQTGAYRDSKGRVVAKTDALDAAVKAIGFNPTKVAQAREATEGPFQDIKLNQVVRGQITQRWAQGIFENDPSKIAEALEAMRTWNIRNPESPIRVIPADVVGRVKLMALTAPERLLKGAPQGLRGLVAQGLPQPSQ